MQHPRKYVFILMQNYYLSIWTIFQFVLEMFDHKFTEKTYFTIDRLQEENILLKVGFKSFCQYKFGVYWE